VNSEIAERPSARTDHSAVIQGPGRERRKTISELQRHRNTEKSGQD
jgi:hypothetical protein